MKIYYNPKLKEKARQLRNNSTFSERMLWKYLKCRQMRGYQFMRQKPIDNYIVDFYCSKLRLVIEIDGITHNYKVEYDNKRQKKLEDLGLRILRFNALYVINSIKHVLGIIYRSIEDIERGTTP